MNNINKYIRFAIGIPIFCIAISGWILFDDIISGATTWQVIFRVTGIVGWTYLGFMILDVPTVNTINLNINNKE